MPKQASPNQRHTLMVDADDTLWENNLFFEQAIAEFIDYLDHSTRTREEVRTQLDLIERQNDRVYGYGSKAFTLNLRHCFELLVERDIEEADYDRLQTIGSRALVEQIILLNGVSETLTVLAERHDLILVTKGNREEQQSKVDRSGLESHFRSVEIVAEKEVDVYLELVDRHGLDPHRTWMIGNSPRSDINPALQAGLGAVFIPHEMTWRLELEDVQSDDPRLIRLQRFQELLEHF